MPSNTYTVTIKVKSDEAPEPLYDDVFKAFDLREPNDEILVISVKRGRVRKQKPHTAEHAT